MTKKMKQSKLAKRVSGMFTSLGILMLPVITLAQGGFKAPTDPEKERIPQTFAGLATRVTNVILIVIAALAVIFLVYGAIQYVTSRGDTQAAEKARNTITYAIIGIIIAILAYAIVNVVFNLVVTQS
jgi:amino acid transporter